MPSNMNMDRSTNCTVCKPFILHHTCIFMCWTNGSSFSNAVIIPKPVGLVCLVSFDDPNSHPLPTIYHLMWFYWNLQLTLSGMEEVVNWLLFIGKWKHWQDGENVILSHWFSIPILATHSSAYFACFSYLTHLILITSWLEESPMHELYSDWQGPYKSSLLPAPLTSEHSFTDLCYTACGVFTHRQNLY